MRIDYRKIWENYNGKIPKDNNGRSYEIHHIDGNRNNNDINNLTCITIEEHYKTHFNQGDFYACACIKKRLDMSEVDRKILSEKISEANINRPNPWNDPKVQAKCKASWKLNYKKENHGFYNKTRPEHSDHMKSIGWGKNKTESHLANHRESWLKSTKDNPIRSKNWNIMIDGNITQIRNLKKFCRDNNLSYNKIHRGDDINGYRLIKEDSNATE
jgi:hypothetical protein